MGHPCHSAKLHPGTCSSAGMRRGTDRQTDRQPWPIYIPRRLRLTRDVMSADVSQGSHTRNRIWFRRNFTQEQNSIPACTEISTGVFPPPSRTRLLRSRMCDEDAYIQWCCGDLLRNRYEESLNYEEVLWLSRTLTTIQPPAGVYMRHLTTLRRVIVDLCSRFTKVFTCAVIAVRLHYAVRRFDLNWNWIHY